MFEKLMDEFDRTYEILYNNLRKINDKKDITPQELDNVKDIATVMAKMSEVEAMNSGDFTSYYNLDSEMNMSRAPHYRVHMSNSRGRDHNTGRYISRHSIDDRMIANLESMMDNAGSDYERQRINDWINKIRMGEGN